MLFLLLGACTGPDEAPLPQGPATPTPLSLTAGVNEHFIEQEIDGENVARRILLHVPPNYEETKALPVLFAFHGNGGIADPFVSQLGPLVDAGHFVGVYPDGHAKSWNLGEEASTADDLAHVEAIFSLLETAPGIDTEKAYAIGFSNGAGMSNFLGVYSDRFLGIAPIASALTVGHEPTAQSPRISVMQWHGLRDDVCPYEGGPSPTGHTFHAAEESIALWAAHAGCDPTPVAETTAAGNRHLRFEGCPEGVGIEHWGIVDAGHGVPPDTEGGLYQAVWGFLGTR